MLYEVITNMSGFVCPDCGKEHNIFSKDGGMKMAQQEEVAFLGKVPIDPAFAAACDNGKPFVIKESESATSKCFKTIIENIEKVLN